MTENVSSGFSGSGYVRVDPDPNPTVSGGHFSNPFLDLIRIHTLKSYIVQIT